MVAKWSARTRLATEHQAVQSLAAVQAAASGALNEQVRAASPRPLEVNRSGRFSQIQDPEKFFSDLGETVEFQIQDLQLHLAGPDPATPEHGLEKVGRLNMARLQAEEVVLADLVADPT